MRPRKGDPQFAARLWEMVDPDHGGMGVPELARRCGVTPHVIYDWVNCKYGVALRNLRPVKDALGCTWDELLGP